MKLAFLLFLILASWQDLKSRRISVWLYLVFQIIGIIMNFIWKDIRWGEAAAAMIPGVCLLMLSCLSRGAIGMGDGLFFIVSAIFLGFWTSIALLLFGLMFCSACSLGIVCWGIAAGVNVRKKRLPFLPFLLPAWILVRLF